MARFTLTSATDDEVTLHRQIAELATLEPEMIETLQHVVKRVLEAAQTRTYEDSWERFATELEQGGVQAVTALPPGLLSPRRVHPVKKGRR